MGRNAFKAVLLVITITAKLHYIEPQGTSVNGSIYPRFEISHIHLFALIVVGPFTIVRNTGSSKHRSSIY